MDISAWLRELGLERYEQAFRKGEIDLAIVPELTDADLKELGIPLGPRKQLLKAISALATGSEPASVPKRPEAERRQLTVMFVDLVGSTALSARLDPEDMREVIRAYQNTVAGEIGRLEGHVAKFMGDGVLAYFGWPRAHEDEAERAVRAGLALTEAIGRLETPTGEALAARVGIATGLVVVGDLIGEGAAQEEAVVGETPNLSARLQQLAEPGQIMIAEGTRRLVGDVFDLADLGARHVKGIAEPVIAFVVVGERPLESRFEAHSGPALRPMVGRDQELALVLERWAQAKMREGQCVLLVGEAGIGKSRIGRALLDALAEERHFRVRYQCSPYHTDSALWPVIQQLNHAAGIVTDDTPDTKLDKLEALLDRADGRDAARLIADLLGLDGTARYGKLDLTPEAQRTRTLEALVHQLLGLAARQPVLLVVEDAHWIDPTTLELIQQFLDQIADRRVLILLTSRPDHQPELAAHPHVTRLTLNRLGRAGVEAIVARLGGDQLQTETIDAIIARTDGVPLYVEELTKAVLETGDAGIPASLHDSLIARLDRLPEVKEVAQAAAVIGREFAHNLLATVASVPVAALNAALDRLIAAELIFRRGTSPGYIFKHALVQEAAYESLLKAKRRELHARVVEALEAQSAGTAPAEPELLAYHCAQAGLVEQAVDYRYRAGQAATARAANAEAAEQFSHGIELLASLPDSPERRRQELDLQTALGAAMIAAKGYAADETGRAFARARALCEQTGDVHRLMPVLNGQLLFHSQGGEPQPAHGIACEMLALAERHDDPVLLIPAHRAMSLVSEQLGRPAVARAHAEQVLTLFDPAQHRVLAPRYVFDQRTVALGYLAVALLTLGYPDQARHRTCEAVSEAGGLSHPASLAQALARSCVFHTLSRDAVGLAETAEATIAIAVEHDMLHFLGHGRFFRGFAWLELGNIGDGLAEIREGEASLSTSGLVLRADPGLAEIQEALATGRPSSDLAAEAMLRLAEAFGHSLRAERHRVAGERLLWSSEPDEGETESHFCRALEIAREQEAKMWELRAATSLARLWANQGERQKAHDLLGPMYGWFTEGFDIHDLKDAKALLDELA